MYSIFKNFYICKYKQDNFIYVRDAANRVLGAFANQHSQGYTEQFTCITLIVNKLLILINNSKYSTLIPINKISLR